jgi:hypothetical protein
MGMAQMEYYSFERVLKELQIEEEELKRLVSEGEIRAFRDDDKMKFKKSDIEGLKKGRMTEPTIILPSNETSDSSEDSEVLLVEEDTSETLLDIDDLESAESSSASVPTVDFSSSEFEDASSASGTITEELTFEEDSGSYVLDSSDDVLIDSSQDLIPVDSSTGEETFVDSDTGLQTEPLDMDLSDSGYGSSFDDSGDMMAVGEGVKTQPAGRKRVATQHIPQQFTGMVTVEAPLSPVLMAFLTAATILLIYSGAFFINAVRGIDTPLTGWLTDIVYQMAPAKATSDKNVESQIKWRGKQREGGKPDAEHARKMLK